MKVVTNGDWASFYIILTRKGRDVLLLPGVEEVQTPHMVPTDTVYVCGQGEDMVDGSSPWGCKSQLPTLPSLTPP